MSKVVFVVGAARTGTSLTALILDALGVEMFGSREPRPFAPKGTMQDQEMSAVIDYWLRCESAQALSAMDELITKRNADLPIWGSKVGGFKDTWHDWGSWPWLHSHADMHRVIVSRCPLMTARSRNRMVLEGHWEGPAKTTAPAFEQATLAARQLARIVAEPDDHWKTAFVSFEDLVGKPVEVGEFLAAWLGLEWTEEVAERVAATVVR